MPGEKGEVGVVEAAGEEGREPESSLRKAAELELVRRMVMLREMGTSSSSGVVDRAAENELYLRSFPRPESGAGPASVSSQSLWRKPMSSSSSSFVTTELRCFFTTTIVPTLYLYYIYVYTHLIRLLRKDGLMGTKREDSAFVYYSQKEFFLPGFGVDWVLIVKESGSHTSRIYGDS